MLKSKKFQIISFIMAGLMAAGGIVMVAYAASLVANIGGNIVFYPNDGILVASYRCHNGLALENDFHTLVKDDFEGGAVTFDDFKLKNDTGFIIFKFVMKTEYDNSYTVRYTITVKDVSGIYVKESDDEGGMRTDIEIINGDYVKSGELTNVDATVIICIGLEQGVSPNTWAVDITVDITATKKN